jgi:phosphatidylserine/phosphatidylglycerophosphate/cardiolipin synthase-like enzyme
MNITQPAALTRAISEGAQVRNFNGAVTYHPKVIVAHDEADRPIRYLLGSANLSYSAFTCSVEAGILSADLAHLTTLTHWFNNLFSNQAELLTPDRLRVMEANWARVATLRTQARLRVRREIQ